MPASPPKDAYLPPDPLPREEPGDLIWAEKVPLDLNPPATIWRMLYHSRSRTGDDVAVSGFAIVPTAAAPDGGRPVFAWGHGTVGQGDQCAPSRKVRDNLPPYGGQHVERGGVVTATDYEGLGTPGEARYAVGVSEGQGLLDSIRAARQLPRVGRLGSVVLAGHSQGGAAALFAGQLARRYAPELDVVGVLASAPGSLTEIARSISSSPSSPFKGAALLTSLGLHADYGDRFDPASFLTDEAQADLPRVAGECVDDTIERWRDRPTNDMLAAGIADVPIVEQVLAENTPGATNPGVPIRIQQGSNDEQVPLTATETLLDRYCNLGGSVTRTIYPSTDHDSVIDMGADDTLQWLTDRYKGTTATNDCP